MSVLFCTPAYGGMILAPHFLSSMALQAELIKQGIAYDWNVVWNESLVHRARMRMVVDFLQSPYKYLMWADADIEYEIDDFRKLWEMNADIGVGVYAMKVADKQWYAAWRNGRLVMDLDQFNGPIEVDYAGTGFMLIKREVIETLARQVPHWEEDGKYSDVPALFMTPIHPQQWQGRTFMGLESEDYHFCRIAREAGFKVMMDPSVRLGHWGLYRYGAQPHKANGSRP